MYKMLSLFDGSGGFPLAASLCDIEPIAASEVEPYPIAVTKSRIPKMKHLGDISKIDGSKIEPVDVITFGSPCQGLSVAGLQKGLEDERSALFFESIRIIKEMRKATSGVYPRIIVFENVPGAFSSNGGADFRLVLEQIVQIAEPTAVMPAIPKGGWSYADSFVGDGWSLAYRVLDAQHIRTAQRQRRCFLVADFGGQCAQKILFERQGLRGDFAKTGKQREETSSNAERCVGADDRMVVGFDGYNGAITGDKLATLGVNCGLSSGRNGVIERVRGSDELTLRAIVRRLTPTECARLQGFPDGWGEIDKKSEFTDEEYRFWLDVRNTHAEINGKKTKEYTKEQMLSWYNKLHTDSAEYKMWGNGVALPCVLYVMQGIEDVLKNK